MQLLYRRESILAIFIFFSQKIIIFMNIWCTAVFGVKNNVVNF